ncbi:MAG: polysaccharide deacetylase family protein [Rhodospirillaceae bacterium]|jgi:poly-beta-1,6-N-acetyl-D-glucosamine N-deacetylase|nr:polysaccharide deacetylase family protein [Rhodospirillaceae bacterium]
MSAIKRPKSLTFRLGIAATLVSAIWAIWATLVPSAASAANSAVVIMYHRFGESDFPSTNTRLEQLESHITELTSGSYTVLPVPEIIRRLNAGHDLPDRTVGITIDDAYRSVYTEAWPRFRAAGLPITVFASTAHLDGGAGRHMTWDQLRAMRKDGADVGHHSVSHLHMAKASAARIDKEIQTANARFHAELGFMPTLFAYPYGEASTAVIEQIKAAGFAAAFGQHSGVIGNTVGGFYLPRFAMNEKYGDLDRLRLAINALPLPVTDVTPPDPMIAAEPGPNNPPAMGFTISRDIGNLGQLACFLSHAGRGKLERLGPSRIELRIEEAFPKGRTRLNCTLPGPGGRWRWYGRQYYRP